MNNFDFFMVGTLLLIMFGTSCFLFFLGRKYALKIKDGGDFFFACILAILIAGSLNFTNSLFKVCLYISRYLSKEEKAVITNLYKKKW